MIKKPISILFLLLFGWPFDGFSQAIYFSVTGDTICYTEQLGFEVDPSHLSLKCYIKRLDKTGFVKTISSFQMVCEASNTCLQTLNKDTVDKYHLQLDGTDGVWGPKSNLLVFVKPTNTRLIDTLASGAEFIYKTTVKADISCLGKKLYSKEFEVMFKGESANSFREFDFVRIRAWQKKGTKKYYVILYVKEHQTLKKSEYSPDSPYQDYEFIF